MARVINEAHQRNRFNYLSSNQQYDHLREQYTKRLNVSLMNTGMEI